VNILNIKKTIRIGTTELEGRKATIRIEIELKDSEKGLVLSMVGYIGRVYAGQVDAQIRYLVEQGEIDYASGFCKENVTELLDIWEAWHLNDTRAGCEHQTLLARRISNGSYDYDLLMKFPEMQKCPFCGYRYGSAWKYQEIPHTVLMKLMQIIQYF